jgi:hypothetical protein
MAWKGYRNPLNYKDLWDLSEEDKSSSVIPTFDQKWSHEQQKADVKRTMQWKSMALYVKVNDGVDLRNRRSSKQDQGPPDVQASLIPALFGAFGLPFLFGSILKLIQDSLAFVSPQILRLVITN